MDILHTINRYRQIKVCVKVALAQDRAFDWEQSREGFIKAIDKLLDSVVWILSIKVKGIGLL